MRQTAKEGQLEEVRVFMSYCGYSTQKNAVKCELKY